MAGTLPRRRRSEPAPPRPAGWTWLNAAAVVLAALLLSVLLRTALVGVDQAFGTSWPFAAENDATFGHIPFGR